MPRQERVADAPAQRPPVSRFLLLVYNVVYLIAFLFYLPLFAWKMLWDRSYRRGIRERMGHVAPSRGTDVVWVHGVSVGEVKAAAPLVHALRREMPSLEVVVSATTPTGANVARDLFPDTRVIFYPLDFWRFPARALDAIRPRLVLLMELELWPNFLNAAEKRRVPVAVVNGRISERSWRGYRRVSWLLPQLDRIDLFSVQNETYAARLRDLGVSPERISVTGNMKHDCLAVGERPRDRELEALLDLGSSDVVLVAGSTHPGEEALLARVACRLEVRLGRGVRLVLAPRHPERSSGVEGLRRELRQAGLVGRHDVVRLTAQRARGTTRSSEPWLVVDTIGELEKVYTVADLVFVGGSLVRHGGQNMLEPVALGKPTLVGPHVWNFQSAVDLLVHGGGLIRVASCDDLVDRLFELASDADSARDLVARGQAVLGGQQGATERTLRRVVRLLDPPAAPVWPTAATAGRVDAG